jgi:phosphoserine phosphatase RsbU/P
MSVAFDVLPCGYVSFTDDGVVKECNLTLSSWLGYLKEELERKSIERIFTLATRIFYNTHFFPLIKLHSQANEIFLSLRDKNNRDIPVLANAKRILEESGYIIHCVFIRVEARKQFEQELLEAKRQAENALTENKQLVELTKSLEAQSLEIEKHYRHQIRMNEDLVQFNKIISHDLQEPIRKIQVFIDLIANDADTTLSARSKTLSGKINTAALRLKMLTNNLEEYIRVDNEKDYVNVDLNATIELAKLHAANTRKFMDFDIEIEKMPAVEGYERQLETLFFHLIDNAIQFRDPSRKLVIKISHILVAENIFRVSKEQYKYTDHIRIIFQDNGIGFSEEYANYVFMLLNKIHTSTGLGIGLPLVKKIVQNHSGHIRVNSMPEKGTRFEIEFPLKMKN